MAIDVEYGGNLVDLTSNITRGPLEKSPGLESMWRVPHYVKVRGAGGSRAIWARAIWATVCLGLVVFWQRRIWPPWWVGSQRRTMSASRVCVHGGLLSENESMTRVWCKGGVCVWLC